MDEIVLDYQNFCQNVLTILAVILSISDNQRQRHIDLQMYVCFVVPLTKIDMNEGFFT